MKRKIRMWFPNRGPEFDKLTISTSWGMNDNKTWIHHIISSPYAFNVRDPKYKHMVFATRGLLHSTFSSEHICPQSPLLQSHSSCSVSSPKCSLPSTQHAQTISTFLSGSCSRHIQFPNDSRAHRYASYLLKTLHTSFVPLSSQPSPTLKDKKCSQVLHFHSPSLKLHFQSRLSKGAYSEIPVINVVPFQSEGSRLIHDKGW